ncbi:restriction endonuclease subunit S [Nostoc sp. TCL240-02]|uniref:restriction endonuclease subunit S n=1 Tax=Nostoc sp. TCL240-02 TaxID=2572090 RepID=UPI00157FB484|nr:restriction endonuclease subunit S [Nostoc sp. TCL240-02]
MREVLVKTEEFKDSPVGRIPKDWSCLTINDCLREGIIIDVQDGNHGEAHPKTDDFVTEGIPFVMAKDLVNGQINIADCHKITWHQYQSLRIGFAHPRDILLSHKGTIGLTAIVPNSLPDVMLTPQVTYYRVAEGKQLLGKFLFWFFQSPLFQHKLQILSAQSTRSYIGITLQKTLLILIPHIDEQKNIAEILDTVDEAIARTSSLITKLKQTKAGLLQDLLTRGLDEDGKLRDPEAHPEQFKDLALGRIPQKWTVKEFGEYIAHLDSGWSPICEAEPVANGEWGVLKTTAVVWSGYNPSESKKLPSNLEPRYSAVVETDDILITRKGPRERVGVVVHIPSTPANLMMPDTVFRVRLKESSPLLPAFIPLTLGSIAVQQDWNRKKVGLAEAQVDINYGIVRETIIYIPPKSEQKYIIQILNTYDTRIRTEEAYLNKLKLQKQGLMQDLLTGKVRLNSIK